MKLIELLMATDRNVDIAVWSDRYDEFFPYYTGKPLNLIAQNILEEEETFEFQSLSYNIIGMSLVDNYLQIFTDQHIWQGREVNSQPCTKQKKRGKIL